MRIAIYSHSIAPSIDGVCRRFTGIIHEMSRAQHQTLLFTLEDAPQDIPSDTQIVTLDHMVFPNYPEKKVAKPSWRSLQAIFAALRSFQPEVIHVVSDAFSQCFVLAGLLLGIPVVGSFHTDLIDLLRTHGAFLAQEWFVLAKEATDSIVLDGLATTSMSFKKKLTTHAVFCDHVLITAVDNQVFNPSKRNDALRKELTFGDPDGFLCVYVGRISEEKRLDVLIEAMHKLTGSRRAHLAIVGDGPISDRYRAMHGNNNIYCKPKFHSHIELAEYYASADVHVSASEFETLGNTVLEAFACGLPVVVPRTQGFQDTVKDGLTGYLFKTGSSDSAVGFLQKLKDDPRQLHDMGQAGLAEVQAYTYASVVADMLQWYQRGMRRRKAQSALMSLYKLFILLPTVALALLAHFLYDGLVNGNFGDRKKRS